MNFNITRNIDNNVYSVVIQFESYGSKTLDADKEMEMIKNFKPSINYSGITFQGNYQYDSGIISSGGLQQVNLTLSNKILNIDETFNATYRVDINSILESEKGNTLDTEAKVAQAKCKLFEDKIREAITTKLTATTTAMSDKFESVETIMI